MKAPPVPPRINIPLPVPKLVEQQEDLKNLDQQVRNEDKLADYPD